MLDGDNLRGMVSSSQSSPALEHLGLPTTGPPGRVSRGLPLAGPDTGSRARELDLVVEGHPKEPATPDSHQLGDPCCSCSLPTRSEEHTSELQSPCNLVCRLLLEKKKTFIYNIRC